jgi:hypothetical protein
MAARSILPGVREQGPITRATYKLAPRECAPGRRANPRRSRRGQRDPLRGQDAASRCDGKSGLPPSELDRFMDRKRALFACNYGGDRLGHMLGRRILAVMIPPAMANATSTEICLPHLEVDELAGTWRVVHQRQQSHFVLVNQSRCLVHDVRRRRSHNAGATDGRCAANRAFSPSRGRKGCSAAPIQRSAVGVIADTKRVEHCRDPRDRNLSVVGAQSAPGIARARICSRTSEGSALPQQVALHGRYCAPAHAPRQSRRCTNPTQQKTAEDGPRQHDAGVFEDESVAHDRLLTLGSQLHRCRRLGTHTRLLQSPTLHERSQQFCSSRGR